MASGDVAMWRCGDVAISWFGCMEEPMSRVETPDRQAMWFWSVLAVLGALLTIVGWWRFWVG